MNRLKELRTSRGLTIRALADLVGISHTQITHIENGKRNLTSKNASRVAGFFGVSVDYLLGKSAEEIYNGFVSSLRGDFLTEVVDSDGSVVQKISDSVPEPIRSRLDVVFVLQYLNDPRSLQLLYQSAKLYSAKEDFAVPLDLEDDKK